MRSSWRSRPISIRVRSHTKLQVRATEWEHAEEERSLLLRGKELSAAESLLSDLDREPRPTQLQTRFILSSRRASGRRQRGIIAVVTAMLLVAASLSVVALTERNASVRNERIAEQRAAESRSRELASASVDQLDADPERSLLLATEAMRSANTPEALAALRTSLSESHVRATLTGHEGPVATVAYSPDGDRLLSASYDHTARIWDLTASPRHQRCLGRSRRSHPDRSVRRGGGPRGDGELRRHRPRVERGGRDRGCHASRPRRCRPRRSLQSRWHPYRDCGRRRHGQDVGRGHGPGGARVVG